MDDIQSTEGVRVGHAMENTTEGNVTAVVNINNNNNYSSYKNFGLDQRSGVTFWQKYRSRRASQVNRQYHPEVRLAA